MTICALSQVARALGARVTGVCSRANAEFVRGLGAHRVIDYTRGTAALRDDLETAVREDGPFDLCFDTVTSREVRCAPCVAPPVRRRLDQYHVLGALTLHMHIVCFKALSSAALRSCGKFYCVGAFYGAILQNRMLPSSSPVSCAFVALRPDLLERFVSFRPRDW